MDSIKSLTRTAMLTIMVIALSNGDETRGIYSDIGCPESNILTKESKHDFVFSLYPKPPDTWGKAENVADETQELRATVWPQKGFQVKADSQGIAFIQVKLDKPYFVRAFAITGYPNGSHKPTGAFFLEGSDDGTNWKMIAEGEAGQWHTPGTYPFRRSQIIKAIYPDKYLFYRVIARGWTNGYMVIYNWGLFT